MGMSICVRANDVIHLALRFDDHGPRLGNRVVPQRAFDHGFKSGYGARVPSGGTGAADRRLEDDVDVAVDEVPVDSENEFGLQAAVEIEPVETEVDAVGGDAVYDRDDFFSFLTALLDTNCGRKGELADGNRPDVRRTSQDN